MSMIVVQRWNNCYYECRTTPGSNWKCALLKKSTHY